MHHPLKTSAIIHEFSSRIGDSGIYTWQGDLVGNIEDEGHREDAVLGLNGTVMEDEDQKIIDMLGEKDIDMDELKKIIELNTFLDENDLDEERLKELIKLDEIHETLKAELNDVKDSLQEIMDRVLLDDLQQDDWDVLHKLYKKVEELAV